MPQWQPIQSPFEPLQRAIIARLHLSPETQALKVFDVEPSDPRLEPKMGEPFVTFELQTSQPVYTDDGVLYEATARLYAMCRTQGAGSPLPLMETLAEVEAALTSRPLEVEGYGTHELQHESAQRLPADGKDGVTRRRAVLDLAFSHYAVR